MTILPRGSVGFYDTGCARSRQGLTKVFVGFLVGTHLEIGIRKVRLMRFGERIGFWTVKSRLDERWCFLD